MRVLQIAFLIRAQSSRNRLRVLHQRVVVFAQIRDVALGLLNLRVRAKSRLRNGLLARFSFAVMPGTASGLHEKDTRPARSGANWISGSLRLQSLHADR